MVSHGLTFKWGACLLHFPQHDHKHVQAVLKFQSPYFNWATDPILQFFPQKHTYKIILRKHLETLLLFTHMAISIHEHNHMTTQTPQVYASVRTYLMSSVSFLFSLPLFYDYEFDYNFSGQKQPCILHLLLFPMKQQHCLYPVCHRPLPPIISSPQFLLCPTRFFWCAAMPVKFVVPAVSLHLSHFTHIVSRHTCTCIILHNHITRYHIFPITYWHVHENYPSVSSGHKSYYTVHAHTNKVIVLKSKRLNFFKWLIKTIIITPQVRRNLSPHKHHHTGPHMAQTF